MNTNTYSKFHYSLHLFSILHGYHLFMLSYIALFHITHLRDTFLCTTATYFAAPSFNSQELTCSSKILPALWFHRPKFRCPLYSQTPSYLILFLNTKLACPFQSSAQSSPVFSHNTNPTSAPFHWMELNCLQFSQSSNNLLNPIHSIGRLFFFLLSSIALFCFFAF